MASTVQEEYLAKKRTWTRKLVIITDAESPMELEDWEETAKKLNEWNVHLTLVYDPPFLFLINNLPNINTVVSTLTQTMRIILS